MTEPYRGVWALVEALLAHAEDRGDADPAALATQVLGTAPTGHLADEVRRTTSVPELARVLLRARGTAPAAADARSSLQSDLVRSLAVAGDPTRAEQLARRLLSSDAVSVAAGPVWGALLHTLLAQGRWQDLVDAADEALRAVDPASVWGARILAERSLAQVWLGAVERARADARTAMERGVALGDPVAASRGAAHLSVIVGNDGDVERSVALAAEGVELAGGDAEALRLHPHMALAMAQLSADRLEAALATLSEGRRVGEDQRTTWDLPLYDAMIALVLDALGRWDDALAEVETGLRLAEELGTAAGRVTALSVMAHVALRRGRFEQAEEAIRQAHEVIAERGPQWGQWVLDRVETALHAAEERDGGALERAAEAWRQSSPQGRWMSAWQLADAAYRRGRPDVVDEVAAWTRRATPPSGLPVAEVSRSACRGLRDGDAGMVRTAAGRAAALGRRPDVVVLTEVAGLVAAAAGDPAGAIEHWLQAREVAEELGADHDLARLDARLREAGARPGPRSPHRTATSGWEALTPTERRVAELAATGLTNPEIGARLFISRRTVQSHLSHVYRKLDIASRVQLASMTPSRASDR